MRVPMKTRTPLLLATLLIACSTMGQGQPQRLLYQWLNVPCGEMLHCEIGCSACNLPAAGGAQIIGTNMAWIGVTTCPIPIVVGDNAVLTTGWTGAPSNDHYLLFSGIVSTPMSIDSIIINHTSSTNGPERVKVEFSNNAAAALEEVADALVPSDFDDLVITDLGPVAFEQGSALGTFQVKITPYQGWGEGWALNEVRVVAHPVDLTTTGISELRDRLPATKAGPWYDVIGRRTSSDPAPGVYLGPGKRVQVF